MQCPILVIFFNRPASILRLMRRISDVKPEKLYLACDGPREAVSGEAELVYKLRDQVLSSVNWDCEVFLKFRDDNFGCKYNVSDAVFWFFENEEKGIVLEDDCIPAIGFFEFASKMLDYYEGDKRVGAISGRNEAVDCYVSKEPYLFVRKFFCWGWASWSDRVVDNNVEIGLTREVPDAVFGNLPWKERLMVKGMIGLIKSRVVNSWAYPFDLSFREKGQLCLIPNKNLVRNIGFDTVGAHAKKGERDALPVCEDFKVTPTPDVKAENDDKFMDTLINKRYPNKLKLIIFSMAHFFAPLKKEVESLGKVFRRLGS